MTKLQRLAELLKEFCDEQRIDYDELADLFGCPRKRIYAISRAAIDDIKPAIKDATSYAFYQSLKRARRQKRPRTKVERICIAIDELRADDDSVTLFSDNDELGGPGCVIECCGAWTEWQDQRIEGDTLIDCLEQAVDEKNIAVGRPSRETRPAFMLDDGDDDQDPEFEADEA